MSSFFFFHHSTPLKRIVQFKPLPVDLPPLGFAQAGKCQQVDHGRLFFRKKETTPKNKFSAVSLFADADMII
ncbi:hypothetical protein HR10_04895 [Porphyromonas gulae]|nr:hypothetical protein HR10_04895 [Porphyromonas gulae]